MAYSIVQKTLGADGSGTASTSFSLTFTQAVTSGKTVMGAVMYSTGSGTDNPPSSIKDSVGNTYTVAQHQWDATATNGCSVFYFVNVSGAPTSLTVTWSSSISYVRIMMLEVSGISAFDTSNSSWTQLSAATTETYSSPTITPAASGEFLYGAFADLNGGVQDDPVNAGTGFTIENQSFTSADGYTPNCGIADEYQTYNSTAAVAASFSVTFTNASSAPMAAILAFKPSGGSAFPPPLLPHYSICIWGS